MPNHPLSMYDKLTVHKLPTLTISDISRTLDGVIWLSIWVWLGDLDLGREGNPLQCSCLENPRDGGAWWAAVYRVAQGRTRLKWLSSSSRAGQNFIGKICTFPENGAALKFSLLVKHCDRGERGSWLYTWASELCNGFGLWNLRACLCPESSPRGSTALWNWQVHKIVPEIKWSA